VVGDFNPQEARAYIQQYYTRLQGTAVPAPPATKPRELPDAILIKHAEPYGKNRRLHMAWHVPAAYTPENAVGDVVARLLGGMEFSRIMANVPGAVFHAAFQESMLGGSVFHLLVEPKPDVDLETLQKQVDMVVNFLRAKAPTEDEVDHAVRRILSDRFGAMEDTLSKAEFLVDLITDGHATGDPLVFEQGRYKNVTPEDVRRFAETYLTSSRRVILHSTPVGAQR
jgi:predicted Zn-dependent peptidase